MRLAEFPLAKLMNIRPKSATGEIWASDSQVRIIMPSEWEAQIAPDEWVEIPAPVVRIMQDTDPDGYVYRLYRAERDPWSRILQEINLAALRAGLWMRNRTPSWDDWLAEL